MNNGTTFGAPADTGSAKITVSLDRELLRQLDSLVAANRFASRSHAVQIAIEQSLKQQRRARFAEECAKLSADEEQQWAEMGIAEDTRDWAVY